MWGGMEFKTFTLDNHLQVLAISHKDFVKSSAAMAVMAGSMQNPEEHLGLAHFLEHMLFLGTEEYPQVGEYEDFLNKHGGGHNAYTSIDHTNYFFEVTHGGFEGALKRFSRFFVNPTFDEKYVEREKNAINSEHKKNLKDDIRREYRFLQIMTDPEHPFSKFATGDKNTLSKTNRQTVMDFYKTHYSSNLMRLVLMSSLPGEALETLAEKHFCDVPNLKLDKPQFPEGLFTKEAPQFQRVETIRDQDCLKISFDRPDEQAYWESKPVQFLAHLLGEEGKGSLLSLLKKRGWAMGLQTSTWWRMFHIKVVLTQEGKKHYEEVIKAVFSFIQLLKKEGLKEFLFKERQELAQLDLQNLEPRSSMDRASQFTASMLYYPVEDFLSRHYLYHKFSNKTFHHFLSYLNPRNLRVSLFTKDKLQNKKEEPFYGIGYTSEDLKEAFIQTLEKIPIYDELQYPQPNPYLPKTNQLFHQPQVMEPHNELYKPFARLFSQVDTELNIPKGCLSLCFVSDKIQGNPANYLKAKLFVALKREELNEWGYPVGLAGLNYGIDHHHNTLAVDVTGYSEHLGKLMKDLVTGSKHNLPIRELSVDSRTFHEVKTKIKRNLLNKEHDPAYQQLLYESALFFSTASIHQKEYISFLDGLSLEEIKDFAQELFSHVAIQGLSFGNIQPDLLKPVVDSFFSSTGAQGLTEEEVASFRNQYLMVPDKKMVHMIQGLNNNNGVLCFYKAGSWSIQTQAFMDVLGKLIEQPYFTELRTHQQLGYVVAGFSSSNHGFCGLGTLIQSQSHKANDCLERSEKFLKSLFEQMGQELKEADVEVVKASLMDEIRSKPNSMAERMARFSLMAGHHHGDFQFLHKLAKEVEAVSVEALKPFIREKLDLSKALIFIYNGANTQDSKPPTGCEKIENYGEILKNWPRHQPYQKAALADHFAG